MQHTNSIRERINHGIFTMTIVITLILIIQGISTSGAIPEDSENPGTSKLITTVDPNPAVVGTSTNITNQYFYDAGDGDYQSPVVADQQIFVYDDASIHFGQTSDTEFLLPANDTSIQHTITYIPSSTLSEIYGIGLALSDVSNLVSTSTSKIILQILEDGTEVVYTSISYSVAQDMISGHQLIIGLGDLTPNYQFPDGFTFTAGTTYTISLGFLDFDADSTYTIAARSGTDSELTFEYDGQTENITPKLSLYKGTKSSVLSGEGTNTYWYTPDRPGIQLIKTEVDDPLHTGKVSHFVSKMEVISSPEVTGSIVAYDYTGSVNQGTLLSASAYDDQGDPLQSVTIDFFIVNNATDYGEEYMGSAITDSTGYASLTADLARGDYSLVAKLAGTAIANTSTIIVPKLQVEIREFSAIGTYSSLATGVSYVTIQGDVYEEGTSDPLEDIELAISNQTHDLGIVTTDSMGKFSLSSHETEGAGTHSDIFTIDIVSSEQELVGGTYSGSLTLYKGVSITSVDYNVTVEYHDQPTNVTGSVLSEWDVNLDGSAFLEYYDEDQQSWNRESTGVIEDGRFSLEIADASLLGNYSYRVVYAGNTNYSSSYDQFTYGVVNNTQYFGETLGVPDDVSSEVQQLYFQEEGNFTILVFDEDGDPISNLNVDILAYDYSQGTRGVIASKITSTSGKITFLWTPTTDQFVIDIENYLLFQVNDSTNSYGYELNDFKYRYIVKRAALDFGISVDNAVYRSPATISITATSMPSGAIPLDIKVDITIEGETSEYTIQNGYLEIIHEYTVIQQETITVEIYVDLENQYYNSTSESYDFQIDKNQYQVTAQDYKQDQGTMMTFSGTLTDIDGDLPTADKQVLIELYTGSVWKSIGTPFTSNGNYVQTYHIVESPGSYQYRVTVDEDSLYYGIIETGYLTVDNITGELIIISAPGSYDYGASDEDRNVTVQFVINGTNVPISFEMIDIQFDEYSWTKTTNEEGLFSFLLPQYIDPGTYELIIYKESDSDYNYVETRKSIQVNGGVTNLVWTIQPPDISYYGQILTVSVRGTNETGGPLGGFTVRLIVGSHNIAKTLNSTGYATWNLELRTTLGDIEVRVELDQQYNYNPASISQVMSHQKARLQLDLGVADGINSTFYSQPENYTYSVYWIDSNNQNQNFKSGTTVEIYWFDYDQGTDGEYVWFATYTLQETGILTLEFPAIDAGSYLKIKWNVTHSDFYGTVETISTLIEQSPIEVSEQVTGTYAGDPFEIMIIITNQLGEPVEGLRVTLLPTTPEEQMIYTDEFGQALFYYTPTTSGSLDLQYNIEDVNGNYDVGSARFVTLQVQQRDLDLSGVLVMIDGTVYIDYQLIDLQNSTDVTTNLQVSLDYYDQTNGGWAFLSYHSDGLAAILDVQETQYRITFPGDSIYGSEQMVIDLVLSDLQVTISNQTGISHSPFSPVMTVEGDQGSLDGMIVEYYILNTTTDEYLLVGTYEITNQGQSTTSDMLLLEAGQYSSKLVIPQQGFYKYFEIELLLTVELRIPIIEVEDPVDVYRNQEYDLVFNLTTDFGDTIGDHGVELYHWDDDSATWVYHGMTYTNSSGSAVFTILDSRSVGSYQYKLISQGDEINAMYEQEFTINLWQEPQLEMSLYEPIVYSDGGKIMVTITDTADGSPIADVTVILYIKEFLSWEQIGTGVTNENGTVIIFVQWEKVGSYSFKAATEATSVFGAKEITATYDVVPDDALILYQLQNFGITNNKTIIIWVADEDQISIANLTKGEIHWTIYTSTSVIYDTGIIEITSDDTYILIIDGLLIGNYSLQLNYLHDKGYYTASQVDLENLGFEQLTAPEIITESKVEFTYEGTKILYLQLLTGTDPSTPLHNLEVLVTIDGTNYQGTRMTTVHGLLTIDLSMLTPGVYNATITIEEGLVVSTTTMVEIEITMELGSVGFDLFIQDSVIYDDPFEISIYDPYNESAYYTLAIYSEQSLIYTANYSSGAAIIQALQGLLPGEYIIQVTRYHPEFVPVTEIGTIELLPKQVAVIITYTLNENSSEVILTFSATMKGKDPTNITYHAVIYFEESEQSYVVINDTLIVKVSGTGSFNVHAWATGYYSGDAELFVSYDFEEFISTTPSGNSSDTIPSTPPSGQSPKGSQSINTKGLEVGLLVVAGLVGSGSIITKNASKGPEILMNIQEKLGPHKELLQEKYQQLKERFF